MFYSIRHLTKFRYSGPVSESLMEVRMHPRSEANQRCLSFQLSVSPRARVYTYRDYLGNSIHHFDVPGHHTQLVIVGEALVDVQAPSPIPYSLRPDAWAELDAAVAGGDYWEALMPSHFARSSPGLEELARGLRVERRDDPLSLLRELNTGIYHWFDYVPKSTRVDSPIEDALECRMGVCQDFAHIMLALVRSIGIPCRYVSGYLYHRPSVADRSNSSATHAWVEAYLPALGWIGFDPTNNLIVGERHIRTAVGRDYADVPPTKGIFKGSVDSELTVTVHVVPSDSLPPIEEEITQPENWSTFQYEDPDILMQQQQQQQQ